jgi:hypothetical protein
VSYPEFLELIVHALRFCKADDSFRGDPFCLCSWHKVRIISCLQSGLNFEGHELVSGGGKDSFALQLSVRTWDSCSNRDNLKRTWTDGAFFQCHRIFIEGFSFGGLRTALQ